jgi:fumarylpyruvate hydrolase
MNHLINRTSFASGAIYCVGKNYPEHAQELRQLEGWENGNAETIPAQPLIFMKPASALETGGITGIPSFEGIPLSENLHHEVELVLLIGENSDGCTIEDAPGLIRGFGVGLDMTLRDVQISAKKAGEPWLKSKGFRKSALISDFVPFDQRGFPDSLEISLVLNGITVQQGNIRGMIHDPASLLHYLSYIYGLRKNDLVFTGTPAGVGKVVPGDRLQASLSVRHHENNDPQVLVSLLAKVV